MMEHRPTLTSPDGSSNGNPPERCPCPLYSRDATQEHQEIPQEHQEIPQENQGDMINDIDVKDEEMPLSNDDPCEKEEIPPEIGPDVKPEEEEEGHAR
ncbi:unnamed protein product, partial [Staurois parvus]